MLKKYIPFLVFASWFFLFIILQQAGLTHMDQAFVQKLVISHNQWKALLYIALFIIRIITFIPSVVFMIVAGFLFSPLQAFLLTTFGLFLSETLVFILARLLVGTEMYQGIVQKYPRMLYLLKRYNIQFLMLAALCPIAPTDVACFLTAATKMKYINYIVAVVVGNLPMMLLYSFLGSSIVTSAPLTIGISIGIFVFTSASYILWKTWNKAVEKSNAPI